MNNKKEMACAMNTTTDRHGSALFRSLGQIDPVMSGYQPATQAGRIDRHDKLAPAAGGVVAWPAAQLGLASNRASCAAFPPPPRQAPLVPIDRASLDALPATGGVYVFFDAQDRPLYVGRSLNLRSGVLAHLHGPEGEPLVRHAHRIQCHRTAGELGAALLENSLIRDLQPRLHKKTRQKRGLFTLRLSPSGQPRVVRLEKNECAHAENLFGIFATAHAAQEALRKLIQRHGLCSIVTGLEPSRGEGLACFGRQIRRCRGACTGEESHQSHQGRLARALQELRILPWPYDGPMGIVERSAGWTQVHVIDRWRYLGSFGQDQLQPQLPLQTGKEHHGFDLNCYKLLMHPYLLGTLELQPLPALQQAVLA